MQLERRAQRSSIPQVALTLALAAAAQREGAQAAVLASEDGLLLAGTGEGFDHQALAAFASLGNAVPARHREGLLRETHGLPLHAAPVRVKATRLFVGTVGDRLGDVSALEAAAGRILGS